MTMPRSTITIAIAALLLALTAGEAAEPTIHLEAPIGGWRHGGQDERDAAVTAAYPTPPVDRGGQRHRALIQGRIAATSAARRPPYLFVVNGNPMPLYTDADGRFLKPWAFGGGSNSVEVRSPDGGERRRVQFYEAHAGKTPARLRVIAGWDDGKAEVDLHIITPEGHHAFWARPILPTGGGLDVDSVDGGGPEIFSLAAPVRGTYLVYVNYWGNFDAAGYNFEDTRRERSLITATIAVLNNENTVHEKRETYVVPLRKIGDLVFVRALRY
jgi:uncharacterized protein YfaP (DUF2135 family)